MEKELTPDDENKIKEIIKKEKDEIKKIICKKKSYKKDDEIEIKKVEEFISNFIENERWRDFRNWCKVKGFTSYNEEDEKNPILLPARMWKVNFEKNIYQRSITEF